METQNLITPGQLHTIPITVTANRKISTVNIVVTVQ